MASSGAVAAHPVTRLADNEHYATWARAATVEERVVAYADKRAMAGPGLDGRAIRALDREARRHGRDASRASTAPRFSRRASAPRPGSNRTRSSGCAGPKPRLRSATAEIDPLPARLLLGRGRLRHRARGRDLREGAGRRSRPATRRLADDCRRRRVGRGDRGAGGSAARRQKILVQIEERTSTGTLFGARHARDRPPTGTADPRSQPRASGSSGPSTRSRRATPLRSST